MRKTSSHNEHGLEFQSLAEPAAQKEIEMSDPVQVQVTEMCEDYWTVSEPAGPHIKKPWWTLPGEWEVYVGPSFDSCPTQYMDSDGFSCIFPASAAKHRISRAWSSRLPVQTSKGPKRMGAEG